MYNYPLERETSVKESVAPASIAEIQTEKTLHNEDRVEKNTYPAKPSVIPELDKTFLNFIELDPSSWRSKPSGGRRKPAAAVNLKQTFTPLPLLIEDIHRTRFTDQGTFIFGFKFASVIIHGHCTRIQQNYSEKKLSVYRIDDGTGAISVDFNQNKTQILENFHELVKLRADIRKQKKLYGKEMFEQMKCLWNTVERRVQTQHRNTFSGKVSVFGRLFKSEYLGIKMNAFEMISDSAISRDYELFWKRYLLKIYETKYLVNDQRTV